MGGMGKVNIDKMVYVNCSDFGKLTGQTRNRSAKTLALMESKGILEDMYGANKSKTKKVRYKIIEKHLFKQMVRDILED